MWGCWNYTTYYYDEHKLAEVMIKPNFSLNYG